MSATNRQSDLETVKGAYDAFERGAIDELIAVFDENIEWVEAEGGPYGGVYRGPDQVIANVLTPLGEEWEAFAVEPERFVGERDTVVALGTCRGTYGKTGKRFEAPFAHAWDLDDGTVVRFHDYTDTVLLGEPLDR